MAATILPNHTWIMPRISATPNSFVGSFKGSSTISESLSLFSGKNILSLSASMSNIFPNQLPVRAPAIMVDMAHNKKRRKKRKDSAPHKASSHQPSSISLANKRRCETNTREGNRPSMNRFETKKKRSKAKRSMDLWKPDEPHAKPSQTQSTHFSREKNYCIIKPLSPTQRRFDA